MANSNLFLKSGFIRAPLQNGLGRYIDQLQRVTIKFCKNHGSSKGMRDFIENDLVHFAQENPSVVVYVKPRRHRSAVVVAEYCKLHNFYHPLTPNIYLTILVNGDRNWMSARNQTREEIGKWLNLMRLKYGDTSVVRYRKHWQTNMPTIQGVWTPFTHRNPPNNLVLYPDQQLGEVLNKQQSATEKLLEIVKQQQIQAKDAAEASGVAGRE